MLKKIISLHKFKKIAKLINYNSSNPNPTDLLAIQTVAAVKLSNNSLLNSNKLFLFDTVIFTLYILRYLCVSNIDDKELSKNFSKDYILKVRKCLPEEQELAKIYNRNIFKDRVDFYNSVWRENSSSKEDIINIFVNEFKNIVTTDYSYKTYQPFYIDSPLPLLDIFEQMKINIAVDAYWKAFPTYFNSTLKDVCEYYNNLYIAKNEHGKGNI